jgi:hypothetical protein
MPEPDVAEFEEPPARIGMALYTLIEPHPGCHRAYNRWYERDHFYSGVMTLPGTLSGQRWVATPELKRRRLPARSPVVPDPARGSFLTTYFVDADRIDEWDAAATATVRSLDAAGRLWPERDHVLTRYLDYQFATYRDPDPVPALQALDHRYPGLVTVVGRSAPDATRDALAAWLHDSFLPGALRASPVASVLTFAVRPFTGERPADLPVEPDPDSRFVQLWFVEASPDAVWDEVFVPLAHELPASGHATLEWMGGFVPTVPGTDEHVGSLEPASEALPPATPTEVVAEYFRRVRARDPRLADLFHDDARLVGLGTVVEGRAAIAAFYAEAGERASPSPVLQGPIVGTGSRAYADIVIALADGSRIHAVDRFDVEDGRIRCLTYFIADF